MELNLVKVFGTTIRGRWTEEEIPSVEPATSSIGLLVPTGLTADSDIILGVSSFSGSCDAKTL